MWRRLAPPRTKEFFVPELSFLCIGFIWFYIGYVSNEFFSWSTWISVHFVRFHWQSQRLAQRSTRKNRKLWIVLFYPILVSSVCQQSFVVQKQCVSKPVCKLAHLEKMLAHSVQGQVGLDARGRRTLDWRQMFVCSLWLLPRHFHFGHALLKMWAKLLDPCKKCEGFSHSQLLERDIRILQTFFLRTLDVKR